MATGPRGGGGGPAVMRFSRQWRQGAAVALPAGRGLAPGGSVAGAAARRVCWAGGTMLGGGWAVQRREPPTRAEDEGGGAEDGRRK